MTNRTVHVTAPSRLHFGLLSFGNDPTDTDKRQFGGVGAMIQKPGLRLSISPAEQLTAEGPLAERVLEFAQRWAVFHSLDSPLRCKIEIHSTPTEHTGLGVGTQLGLAVACGLNAFYRLPTATPIELALSVGRGLRSAVGTYGFTQGGLIVERGKLPSDRIAPLDCRLSLPDAWRFVLLRSRVSDNIAGDKERSAFAELPAVPAETTQQLIEELRQRMIPAAAQADFPTFSQSLFTFGRLAGSCFAKLQGGPYNGPHLCGLVETIRSLGITGVGQSSWGPTLFALLPNESQATDFLNRLQETTNTNDWEIHITPPDNHGVRVEFS